MADSQFILLGRHLQGVFNNIIDAVNSKQAAEAGKGLSTNDFNNTYKTKLDGISSGAEVNQNAFSFVSDGVTELAARSSTDTLRLTSGGATTLSYDFETNSIEISSVNTTYSVGDGGLTQKNFTTALFNKLNGIEAGAQANNLNFSTVNVGDQSIAARSVGDSFSIEMSGMISAIVTENTVTFDVPNMYYSLPIATASALGGIKVGSGLSINGTTGVLSLAAGYATEQYVNNAVAAVIDAAPAALDTLNELAAALGDDANFATTVTNALATKVTYEYLGTAEEAILLLQPEGGLNTLN